MEDTEQKKDVNSRKKYRTTQSLKIVSYMNPYLEKNVLTAHGVITDENYRIWPIR